MNTNFTLTEASLIAGCIAGDRKTQKALYDLYSPKLFTICLRYTKNHDDAADVLQEGFVKLFSNLHKYKGEGSFDGWVRRIFVNTCIGYLRSKKPGSLDTDTFENRIVSNEPSALENLYNKDIISTAETLSKGYQTIFNMYAIEGYTHKEIAQKLGITEGTSKSQFSRAKALLRTMVQGNKIGGSFKAAV